MGLPLPWSGCDALYLLLSQQRSCHLRLRMCQVVHPAKQSGPKVALSVDLGGSRAFSSLVHQNTRENQTAGASTIQLRQGPTTLGSARCGCLPGLRPRHLSATWLCRASLTPSNDVYQDSRYFNKGHLERTQWKPEALHSLASCLSAAPPLPPPPSHTHLGLRQQSPSSDPSSAPGSNPDLCEAISPV